MSPTAQLQPLLAPQNDSVPSTGSAAKKKNKKKKSAAAKANAAQAASASASLPTAPSEPEPEINAKDDSATDNGKDEPVDEPVDDQTGDSTTKDELHTPNGNVTPSSPSEAKDVTEEHAQDSQATNGHAIPLHLKSDTDCKNETNGHISSKQVGNGAEATDKSGDTRNGDEPIVAPTSTKDEAAAATQHANTNTSTQTAKSTGTMSQDDEALRAEVERLRKQVEELVKAREEQKEETEQLKTDLEESEAGREQAETQYQNLLGRVEKIKETLGERLKRDRQELEEAKDRIEELEEQNETLREGGTAAEAAAMAAEAQVARLQKELDDIENEHERESNAMRGRAQLSQQNWQREKTDLERSIQQLRKELEEATVTMGEWEVIALEERSVRSTMSDKVADLEEELAAAAELNQRFAEERETHTNAIEGLQRALEEIQETRKMELREMVSDSEAKLNAAEKRALAAEAQAAEAMAQAAKLEKEVQRTLPFEREVKEKNALIGKLRHEAIALNDHLTKALRYIKKNRPDDSVDKQVVTNLLLQFLALDRSDPKKFQVLQVIAGMLQWSDEQKEKAGLSRPGAAGSSLRMPSSPFARTPSTPALNSEFFSDAASTGGARESLSELWANFLERSVDEAAATPDASNPSSRKGSNPPAPPLPEK